MGMSKSNVHIILLQIIKLKEMCCIYFYLYISKVSALTSSLVDSIPVTAMMVKVVVSLAENEALNLPVQPLVWAVAFGPCLGGQFCFLLGLIAISVAIINKPLKLV